MITWEDEGIVLAARPHGEAGLIVQLLTRSHGRYAGMVRGGQSARQRGVFQPGNMVSAHWSARLAEHLGSFACELTGSPFAGLLGEADRLAGLSAAAALCEAALPERESHRPCYEGLAVLLDALEGPHWAEIYVKWEVALLGELGFGLELTRCAAGGDSATLSHVSPKSGCAVSRVAAEPYLSQLIALPPFLVGRGEGGPREVAQGLYLTGFFLKRHIFHPQNRDLPPARLRLVEHFGEKEPE
ncbi:MAG: DNA repair protein RecO [Pseudomonadota bacterium]